MRAFQSSFGPRMQAFLELKRAMGRRYEAGEDELRRFDHFVAGRAEQPQTITRELAVEWLRSKPHVCPVTQRSRVVLLRQFCLYLVRLDPSTFVPERSFFLVRMPRFKAHIYSPEEFRALLEASLRLRAVRWPIKAFTIHTMLLVLYSTGLRAGEIGRLRIGDVNLDAGTLFVRETKFFKSRLVPLAPALLTKLRDFFSRRVGLSPVDSEAPFFLNWRRRAFSGEVLSGIFRALLKEVGISSRGSRAPRLHDVRHTFAVHRVLRWYREGADVQAKLPLLATYMGHANVLSTHHYLTATPEILQQASQRFESSFGSLVVEAGGAR